jgi:glycosyltransferase involved in cell wall biosynthesis
VDGEAVEIITPSQWSRVGFLASGFDERRVHVIPHGVDPGAFWHPTAEERRRVRASLQIPEDAHVFLNIGAITWNKGIGVLLAAFAAYQQRDPRAILLLKGGDQLYGNIIKSSFEEAGRLIKGGGFPQSAVRAIRYSGNNLSLPELASLYRAADAYVSPYRAEGFNLPALEALASGILPIVTGGGATEDFCPDHLSLKVASFPGLNQEGGRFLEPNLESLLACMQNAINDTALRARVAVDGPRWVAERFTWERVSRTLADRLAA